MTDPVYLDYAATTPLAAVAAEAMAAIHRAGSSIGNPSSPHPAGLRARQLIRRARADVAALINAAPEDIVFTSGATEANNLAICGGARFRAHRGRHLVTMTSEHKAVAEPVSLLEQNGYNVTRLAPDEQGRLDVARLADAIRPDTQLVSIMHVNNETGVVQDIEAIAALCRERDILMHSDAAQSAGKLPIDVGRVPVDLLALSAHKMYGPQGIGALYVAPRRGCGVVPVQVGGAQESRRRAGTEPVALLAGFGAAARLAVTAMEDDARRVRECCARLWAGICDLPGVMRNGSSESHYPGILNVSVEGVEGESLMLALEPLCVASGAACNSRSGEASPVLRSMGRSDRQAQSAIRFSFGRPSTPADVDAAIDSYRRAVLHLQRISALAAGSA